MAGVKLLADGAEVGVGPAVLAEFGQNMVELVQQDPDLLAVMDRPDHFLADPDLEAVVQKQQRKPLLLGQMVEQMVVVSLTRVQIGNAFEQGLGVGHNPHRHGDQPHPFPALIADEAHG